MYNNSFISAKLSFEVMSTKNKAHWQSNKILLIIVVFFIIFSST